MGIYYFVSIVLIVASILQIILFFKVWGMTTDVNNIKHTLGSTDNYSFLAWTGNFEAAHHVLCYSMYKELVNTSCWQYIERGKADKIPQQMDYSIRNVKSIIVKYERKFEAIGCKIPENLSSIEKMNEFASKLNS